jgi:hypothetical protein
MADEPPKVDLEKILRETKPPWMSEGGGIRGNNPRRIGGPPPAEVAGGRYPIKIEQSLEGPPFPQIESVEQKVETSDEASADSNTYSFKGEVNSIDKETGEVEIHVGYGEIGQPGATEPPDGMTGADDYFLTISVDGTEIYAVITYDINTLEITSRSLAFAADVPESTVDTGTGIGTIYVPLIAVDIEYDSGGKIKEVVVRNRFCGDIVFVIMYGSVNGQAAFIPVPTLAGWTPAFPA